jgi:peptidoglycan/xylan/chitin deacetylase (PgdA/CDA1 family)
MKKICSTIIPIIVALVFLVSCGKTANNSNSLQEHSHSMEEQLNNENQANGEQNKIEENADKKKDEISEDEENVEEDYQPEVDLKGMGVNEAGKIMILMYHEIGEKEDVWVRTPDNFRKDLETLYEKGYRSISMKDYMNGDINTPPGTTPVVIVFDDGSKGQFNIIDEEKFTIDPDCAVGILEEFNKKHPDFGLEATFYIYYPNPFRQKDLIEKKMRYIVDKGMDIGNHSYTHDNLKKHMDTGEAADAQYIQESLGKNVEKTREILPGYEVDSLALPYGATPPDELEQYVVEGTYDGTHYQHKGVLLVGSNPAVPPYHIDADMMRIPRVRASEIDTYNTGIYDWLEYFENNPEERFISDGDVDTISIPIGMEEKINSSFIQNKKLQTYE